MAGGRMSIPTVFLVDVPMGKGQPTDACEDGTLNYLLLLERFQCQVPMAKSFIDGLVKPQSLPREGYFDLGNVVERLWNWFRFLWFLDLWLDRCQFLYLTLGGPLETSL